MTPENENNISKPSPEQEQLSKSREREIAIGKLDAVLDAAIFSSVRQAVQKKFFHSYIPQRTHFAEVEYYPPQQATPLEIYGNVSKLIDMAQRSESFLGCMEVVQLITFLDQQHLDDQRLQDAWVIDRANINGSIGILLQSPFWRDLRTWIELSDGEIEPLDMFERKYMEQKIAFNQKIAQHVDDMLEQNDEEPHEIQYISELTKLAMNTESLQSLQIILATHLGLRNPHYQNSLNKETAVNNRDYLENIRIIVQEISALESPSSATIKNILEIYSGHVKKGWQAETLQRQIEIFTCMACLFFEDNWQQLLYLTTRYTKLDEFKECQLLLLVNLVRKPVFKNQSEAKKAILEYLKKWEAKCSVSTRTHIFSLQGDSRAKATFFNEGIQELSKPQPNAGYLQQSLLYVLESGTSQDLKQVGQQLEEYLDRYISGNLQVKDKESGEENEGICDPMFFSLCAQIGYAADQPQLLEKVVSASELILSEPVSDLNILRQTLRSILSKNDEGDDREKMKSLMEQWLRRILFVLEESSAGSISEYCFVNQILDTVLFAYSLFSKEKEMLEVPVSINDHVAMTFPQLLELLARYLERNTDGYTFGAGFRKDNVFSDTVRNSLDRFCNLDLRMNVKLSSIKQAHTFQSDPYTALTHAEALYPLLNKNSFSQIPLQFLLTLPKELQWLNDILLPPSSARTDQNLN